MGNYKFKLSNILTNAWFYKLRDMGKASKKKEQEDPSKTKQAQQSCTRKSYYFTRELATGNERHYNSQSPKDTPRKSLKHKAKRRAVLVRSSPSNKLVKSPVSAGCGCRKKPDDQLPNISTSSPENEAKLRSDSALLTDSFDEMLSLSSLSVSRVANSSDKDIIINIDKNSLSNKLDSVDSSDMLSAHNLPPIITKDVKEKEVVVKRSKEANAYGNFPAGAMSAKTNVTKEVKNTHVKRFSGNSPGVKLRGNSPRISSRKIPSHSYTRKSISSSRFSLPSSYAVVKSSFDPQRDFRESMKEMIIENNIKSSKELEDLLASYLSLNSDEYHGLIIKVFKQIWCDLSGTN